MNIVELLKVKSEIDKALALIGSKTNNLTEIVLTPSFQGRDFTIIASFIKETSAQPKLDLLVWVKRLYQIYQAFTIIENPEVKQEIFEFTQTVKGKIIQISFYRGKDKLGALSAPPTLES